MDQNGDTPKTPRPFLRKGSRHEPSALRRILRDKSAGSFPGTTSATTSPNEFSPDENKVNYNRENISVKKEQKMDYEHVYDYCESSSLSPTALLQVVPELTERRMQQQREIDEFAALERQLDEDEKGSVTSSRVSSHNHTHTLIAPSTAFMDQQLRTSTQSLPVDASVACLFVEESPTITTQQSRDGNDEDLENYDEYEYDNFEDYISPPIASARPVSSYTGVCSYDEREGEGGREGEASFTKSHTHQLYLSSDEDDDERQRSLPPFEMLPGKSERLDHDTDKPGPNRQSQTWGAVTRPLTATLSSPKQPPIDNQWDIPFFQVGSSSRPPSRSIFNGGNSSVSSNDINTTEVTSFDQEYSETESDANSVTAVNAIHSSRVIIRSRPKIATGKKIRQPPRARESPPNRQSNPQPSPAADLIDKAKALETELEQYRSENAALRQARRQQESILEEIVQQRNEVARWAAEERRRTEDYCNEQRQAAARERRTAAKQAREAREKEQISVRKERAEVEALEATVEKLKVDLDKCTKKAKANDKRLSQLLKDASENVDTLERQCFLLEQEKIDIWTLLEGSNLGGSIRKRLAQLRSKRNSTNVTQGSAIENMSADELKKMRKALADSAKSVSLTNKHRPYGSTFAEEIELGEETGLVLTTVEDAPPMTPDYVIENGVENSSIIGRTSSFRPTLVTFEPSMMSTIPSPSVGVPVQLQARSTSGPSGSELLKLDLEGPGLEDLALRGGSSSWSRVSKGSASARYSDERASQSSIGSCSTDNNRQGFQPSQIHSQKHEPLWQQSSTERSPAVAASVNGQGSSVNSRVVELTSDGSRIIRYRNGTVKETKRDGSSEVRFTNGDIKRISSDAKVVVYLYYDARTRHTTYGDGVEIYEFPNGQVERHFPDGRKEIDFPDKTRKFIHNNGDQESIFSDGVIVREYASGKKEIITPEGHIEPETFLV